MLLIGLFLIMAALKAGGLIGMSWWWVCLPLYLKAIVILLKLYVDYRLAWMKPIAKVTIKARPQEPDGE